MTTREKRSVTANTFPADPRESSFLCHPPPQADRPCPTLPSQTRTSCARVDAELTGAAGRLIWRRGCGHTTATGIRTGGRFFERCARSSATALRRSPLRTAARAPPPWSTGRFSSHPLRSAAWHPRPAHLPRALLAPARAGLRSPSPWGVCHLRVLSALSVRSYPTAQDPYDSSRPGGGPRPRVGRSGRATVHEPPRREAKRNRRCRRRAGCRSGRQDVQRLLALVVVNTL